MEVTELMRELIPSDIFQHPESGTIEERAQMLIDQCHPAATKMQIQKITAETGLALIPWGMENRALHGLLHGGAYFTAGDTITAIMCMYHVKNPKERMVTVNASIRYLRPVEKDTVTMKAVLKKSKENRYDFTVDFYNEQNKRAAQAKYTYVVVEVDE